MGLVIDLASTVRPTFAGIAVGTVFSYEGRPYMKIFSCTSQDGITKNAVSLKDGLTVTFFPESDVGVLPRGTKLEVN